MARVKAGKLVLGFLVYGLTVSVVVVMAGLWWLDHELKKPSPLSESKLFEVEPGASSGGIAQKLATEGIIEHAFVFKIAARITGAQSGLKAGEYELPPSSSIRDILALMQNGTTFGRRFTIPEGLTSYEIVQILNAIPELGGEVAQIPAEGMLLPNTYDYKRNEDRQQILKRVENAMRRDVLLACGYLHDALDWNAVEAMSNEQFLSYPCPEDVQKKRFDGMEPTVKNVLTLASIVEKETGVEEERKRIAGVFLNRLKNGIALQTDPTVIYAITKGKHKNDGQGPLGRRLLSKDLEIDSPYNTYKYPGLPPGPIANPGRAAIEAVIDPEHHDFIYFVADGTGGHIFAATLEEHNRNVANWRKIRRDKEKK